MTKIEALEIELKCRKLVDETKLDCWRCVRNSYTKENLGAPLQSYNVEYIEVAIGVIDGNPVWGDSKIYGNNGAVFSGKEVVAMCGGITALQQFHWNPPAPKTVMVELLVEDAKFYTKPGGYTNLIDACRKALEQMK